MEIDSVWNMAFEIVGERSPHINDAERRMIHEGRQLCCLNKSGMVKILEWKGFGIEEVRNKKEK
jgi:hypothetical protein